MAEPCTPVASPVAPPAKPAPDDRENTRRGVIAALAAFTFWGFAPIYFKLLAHVPALEIIAHRIIWAVPFLALFLALRDGRALLRRLRLPWRTVAGLALSGSLVALNWLVFVWAVTHDQVMATSLGYFINPLVNVLLGFLLLRERLTAVQTSAVLLAAAGTAYLGWFLGTPPWIALTLAFSFGFYGLLRKQLDAGPMVGLMWECLLLLLPAFGYLAWLGANSTGSFGEISTGTDWLLVFAGLVTVLPLTWFAMAARRLKLSVVGFFQYLAPTLTFLLAVFLYGEPFTPGHAVAFTCIWAGLALISWETLRAMRGVRHA